MDRWQDAPRQTVDGIAWIELGDRDAPAVVLIHGVGLRAESWAFVGSHLAQTARILMVDMPGHGESRLLPGEPSLADYTDCLAGWMASLKEPAVVAGHSMGALLSLDLAIKHARLVAGLMPCNAVYRRSAQAASAVRARADALTSGGPIDATAPLSRWFPDPESFGPERDASQDWLERADPAGYAAAYRVFATEDGPTDEALRGITCPTTFLTGALEPNSTPAMSHAMAALVPGADAVIVPYSHHMTPMTHAEAVAGALVRLMERTAHGPAGPSSMPGSG